MPQSILQFTYDCNMTCRHCAYGAGPGGPTMASDDAIRVLDHLSPDTSELVISGGEPTVQIETLRKILVYVNSIRERRFNDWFRVRLSTNGAWARDEDFAYTFIREMQDVGVDEITVSKDRFHREQGLDTEMLVESLSRASSRVKEEAFEEGNGSRGKITVGYFGEGINAMPFGRGRNLSGADRREHSGCKLNREYRNDYPTIAPDGQVYPCCWTVTPSIGSAIERPIDELYQLAGYDPIFSALFNGGPAVVASELGFDDFATKASRVHNICVVCEELFLKAEKEGKLGDKKMNKLVPRS